MTLHDSGPHRDDLVATLRRASCDLIGGHTIRDRDTMLGRLVATAVTMVPAAVGGGLSRTEERRVRSSHATDEAVYELDQLQDRLGEGPCIEAADDPPRDGTVQAHDLTGGADAERWPRFAPEAVSRGFRSMLSVSLTSDPRRMRSALNLYAETPHAFSADDRTTAGVFASHAGALLYGADQAALLGAAVDSRDTIGQAKGILMERFSLSADESFQMLVKSSQDTNLKLVEVARWLVGETEARREDRGAPSEAHGSEENA